MLHFVKRNENGFGEIFQTALKYENNLRWPGDAVLCTIIWELLHISFSQYMCIVRMTKIVRQTNRSVSRPAQLGIVSLLCDIFSPLS